MADLQFKISEYKMNEPQKVELLYDKPREEDGQYGKKRSTKVVLNGQEAWWNLTDNMFKRWQELDLKKGDVISVTRRYNDKTDRSFTDIQIWGNITEQKQNLTPVNQPSHQQKGNLTDVKEPPNWDKINWAKCKSNIVASLAPSLYEKGITPNDDAACLWIELWASYCMEQEKTISEVLKPRLSGEEEAVVDDRIAAAGYDPDWNSIDRENF